MASPADDLTGKLELTDDLDQGVIEIRWILLLTAQLLHDLPLEQPSPSFPQPRFIFRSPSFKVKVMAVLVSKIGLKLNSSELVNDDDRPTF
jgi:hypothetical protein